MIVTDAETLPKSVDKANLVMSLRTTKNRVLLSPPSLALLLRELVTRKNLPHFRVTSSLNNKARLGGDNNSSSVFRGGGHAAMAPPLGKSESIF